MAIYHLHVKNISRRDGRSAVAAAAYRAGETLANEAEERESAFGGRRDVLMAAIVLPEGAPDWMSDRAALWNGVERAEKRRDARLAKEIEFALPREIPQLQWRALAQAMAEVYVARGHVVDMAIHSDALHVNPHVHLMLTTRRVTAAGFAGKLREADGLEFVTQARAVWASIANAALGKVGAGIEIDPRSHEARGIASIPSTHRGPDRAERRARRQRERGGPPSMTIAQDRQMVEELAALPRVRDLFPNLVARPDWPPSGRTPPDSLEAAGQREFAAFWQTVDTMRSMDPSRPDAPSGSAADLAPVSLATLRDWERLERAVHARMRADGHDPGPLSDWTEVRAGLAAFREQLDRVRALETENAILRARWGQLMREAEQERPVPGPDRELIASAEQARAEDAMLAAMEGDGAISRVPKGPDAARRAAEVEARQGPADAWWQSHESRTPEPRQPGEREEEPDRWWR